MKTWITRFDEELLAHSKKFSEAAEKNPDSRAVLEKFGFTKEEQERGKTLVRNVERSFEWERAGKAWNFLSATPERRQAEARHWFKDSRKRHVNDCIRGLESVRGVRDALALVVKALSPAAYLAERAELKRNLERAAGPRPADAPPPKDTALVELAGWYEHWRLLAQRLFRQRPDMMAPYGLKPGKAPPRLRGKEAKEKYGERAVPALGGLAGAKAAPPADDDEDDDAEPVAVPPPGNHKPPSLPIIQ